MDGITSQTRNWLSQLLSTDCAIEKHGYSNQDDVYEVRTSDTIYYLKIASSLQAERDNLDRIEPYLRVPRVMAFSRINNKDHLLMSVISGKNLAELVGEWTDMNIVKEFAAAVRSLHALDVDELFPENTQEGLVVVHGDMALPNIICEEPGLVGYVDFAQMSVGMPDIDLADALWSLQRNISPDYGEIFLQAYGNVVMTEKLNKALKFKYRP